MRRLLLSVIRLRLWLLLLLLLLLLLVSRHEEFVRVSSSGKERQRWTCRST